jgi:hypothetical protein
MEGMALGRSCAAKPRPDGVSGHLLFLVENEQKQIPRSAWDNIVGAFFISLLGTREVEEGEALYGWLGAGLTTWDGQAARGAASPVPDGTRASQSHSGRGKVLGRSPVCLRSKPECRFVSWGSCS